MNFSAVYLTPMANFRWHPKHHIGNGNSILTSRIPWSIFFAFISSYLFELQYDKWFYRAPLYCSIWFIDLNMDINNNPDFQVYDHHETCPNHHVPASTQADNTCWTPLLLLPPFSISLNFLNLFVCSNVRYLEFWSTWRKAPYGIKNFC